MDNLMDILTIVLIFLVFLIIILAFIYWYISYKNKRKQEEEENVGTTGKTRIATEYTKKSIFKFMQFDKIEDNMIIQDKGARYLMVIECEGINYDLMSQVEKNAVEAGFVQFLNTLRYPIQIYTQTRTINIANSITNYRNRVDSVKKELTNKQYQYDMLVKDEDYNTKQEETLRREIVRLKNLHEYGADVVNNIEKVSQNKNVLSKHYYIVVPYYTAEIATDLLEEEERRSLIFSELYTRAQSLIRALFSCEMKCKILNSTELVELLYVAYNRDDSEIFGVNKAIESGYSELYSTAPDVLDKQMRAINEQIEEEAKKLAKETISDVRAEKARRIKKKQDDMEALIHAMAESLVKENQIYVGKEVTEEAVEKIKSKKTKKGGKANEQKSKKTSNTNAG